MFENPWDIWGGGVVIRSCDQMSGISSLTWKIQKGVLWLLIHKKNIALNSYFLQILNPEPVNKGLLDSLWHFRLKQKSQRTLPDSAYPPWMCFSSLQQPRQPIVVASSKSSRFRLCVSYFWWATNIWASHVQVIWKHESTKLWRSNSSTEYTNFTCGNSSLYFSSLLKIQDKAFFAIHQVC